MRRLPVLIQVNCLVCWYNFRELVGRLFIPLLDLWTSIEFWTRLGGRRSSNAYRGLLRAFFDVGLVDAHILGRTFNYRLINLVSNSFREYCGLMSKLLLVRLLTATGRLPVQNTVVVVRRLPKTGLWLSAKRWFVIVISCFTILFGEAWGLNQQALTRAYF